MYVCVRTCSHFQLSRSFCCCWPDASFHLPTNSMQNCRLTDPTNRSWLHPKPDVSCSFAPKCLHCFPVFPLFRLDFSINFLSPDGSDDMTHNMTHFQPDANSSMSRQIGPRLNTGETVTAVQVFTLDMLFLSVVLVLHFIQTLPKIYMNLFMSLLHSWTFLKS